jgi:hypothetical protein
MAVILQRRIAGRALERLGHNKFLEIYLFLATEF